ncbi:MAG: DUF6320 domain-containing protein [Candidatus Faecousia sp.]|nr:DUF6320 domain-containing protein [Bacillota bacterium]MDY4220253.1 DUF6320 domain-containing protein [Candidatus Faecousia sp.]
MYCMNCGVRLGDSEKRCPLCGLRVYHPDLEAPGGEPLYPRGWAPPPPERSGLRFVLTLVYLAAVAACLLVDLNLARKVTWSGFAVGGASLAYLIMVFPLWFYRPDPSWMVPVDFLGAGLLLLYIDLKTHGGWFLSFAFPVTGIYGILSTVLTALVCHLRKGYFFIFGGSSIAFGCSAMLLEMFQVITFGGKMFSWSLYPVAVLSALGIFWLLCGIIRPLGDGVRKRIFI